MHLVTGLILLLFVMDLFNCLHRKECKRIEEFIKYTNIRNISQNITVFCNNCSELDEGEMEWYGVFSVLTEDGIIPVDQSIHSVHCYLCFGNILNVSSSEFGLCTLKSEEYSADCTLDQCSEFMQRVCDQLLTKQITNTVEAKMTPSENKLNLSQCLRSNISVMAEANLSMFELCERMKPVLKHRLEASEKTDNTEEPSTPRERSKRSVTKSIHEISNAITFMDATSFITGPAPRLYDRFSLRFALKTDQTDGILLFSSGAYGVDFIAFELHQGRIILTFDMGSGYQQQYVTNHTISDQKWHTIHLIRSDIEQNILNVTVDEGCPGEYQKEIKVLQGHRSKNFDLTERLYLGGVPMAVYEKWREKLKNRYGFQGCLANLSVNDQPSHDMFRWITDNELTQSSRNPSPRILPSCVERPSNSPRCGRDPNNMTSPCLYGGICLQLWTDYKCSCERTTFGGYNCDKPGTTFSFGLNDSKGNHSNVTLFPEQDFGYLRITFTDYPRSTRTETFGLSFQIESQTDQTRGQRFMTLLFVVGAALMGDFIHLYVQDDFLHLDCNFGAGKLRVIEKNLRVSDGHFHRILVHRTQSALKVNLDQYKSTYNLRAGTFGKQFDNQESIWLGHAPHLNRTDFFKGYISGAFYNGLQLNELASGLQFAPFIQIMRYANVRQVSSFRPRLGTNSPFRNLAYVAEGEDVTGSSRLAADSAMSIASDVKSADAFWPSVGLISTQSSASKNQSFLPGNMKENALNEPAVLTIGKVNIWLLLCVTCAGSIVLAALTFLVYRFHIKKSQRILHADASIRNSTNLSTSNVKQRSEHCSQINEVHPLLDKKENISSDIENVKRTSIPPICPNSTINILVRPTTELQYACIASSNAAMQSLVTQGSLLYIHPGVIKVSEPLWRRNPEHGSNDFHERISHSSDIS